jgi:hypothetical protein
MFKKLFRHDGRAGKSGRDVAIVALGMFRSALRHRWWALRNERCNQS